MDLSVVRLLRETPLRDGLAALADETRLRILFQLRERHERCRDLPDYAGIHVADLVQCLGLSQAAVSKHLAVLRAAGLVSVTRRGNRSYYQRDEAAIGRLKAAIAGL
jgi:DNA-binding transcriptional ArsR family regulator